MVRLQAGIVLVDLTKIWPQLIRWMGLIANALGALIVAEEAVDVDLMLTGIRQVGSWVAKITATS